MPIRLSACAAALLLVLSGCKDRQITAYRAPKDPPPALPGAPAGMADNGGLPPDHPPIGGSGDTMASTAVPTGSNDLVWTAPAAWKAMPDRPMRKATFGLKGAGGVALDLSITSFPGDTGGLLANVNRWRGQLGLDPVAEADLPASLTHLDAHGLHFDVANLVGNAQGAPTRMLGAILPYQGDTWFFKLMGPADAVAAQKEAFLAFLRTVTPR